MGRAAQPFRINGVFTTTAPPNAGGVAWDPVNVARTFIFTRHWRRENASFAFHRENTNFWEGMSEFFLV